MDKLRILNTLNTYGVRIPLRRALELSQALFDLHSQRVIEAENNAFDRGYRQGQDDLKNKDGLVTELRLGKLEKLEEFAFTRANELIPGIVQKIGRDRKIQCIREVRENTGLGLKEAKEVVDNHLSTLDAIEVGFQQTPSGYYGDEPPF